MLRRTPWRGGRCPPRGDVMEWLWAGTPLGQPLGPGSWASGLSPPGISALKEKSPALPGIPEPQSQVKGGLGGWQLSALPGLGGT